MVADLYYRGKCYHHCSLQGVKSVFCSRGDTKFIYLINLHYKSCDMRDWWRLVQENSWSHFNLLILSGSCPNFTTNQLLERLKKMKVKCITRGITMNIRTIKGWKSYKDESIWCKQYTEFKPCGVGVGSKSKGDH